MSGISRVVTFFRRLFSDMHRNRTSVHVLVLADVAGDDRYHAGDEAMFIADLDLIRSILGPVSVTIYGPHSRAAAARYGTKWHRDAGFDKCVDETSCWALWARCDTPTSRISRLLKHVDVVVLAGGGNLCSSWPEHIYERALVVRRAALAGVPVLVLGQTIGPHLTDDHRAIIAELLRNAELVGVRESDSANVARDLGVPEHKLLRQADDALFLEGQRPTFPPGFDPDRPWVAVTVHPFADPGGPEVARLARNIVSWADGKGLQVLYVPHCRAPEGPGGSSDVDISREMVRAGGGYALVPPFAPVPDAHEAAWAAREASFVVSSRYHPLVFATSAGVPCLGLPVDEYTRTKIVGALRHVGRESDVKDLWEVVSGGVADPLERVSREISRRGTHGAGSPTELVRLEQQRRRAVEVVLHRLRQEQRHHCTDIEPCA